MKLKHTPTPWRENGNGMVAHPVSGGAIPTGKIETPLGEIEIIDSTNECGQNLPFIIKAVNEYAALNEIAAISESLRRHCDGDTECTELLEMLSGESPLSKALSNLAAIRKNQ